MSTLSEKSYAKFFGQALLEEVLNLMPELEESVQAHPLEAHPVLHNFLQHLSSHTYRPGEPESMNEAETRDRKAEAAKKASGASGVSKEHMQKLFDKGNEHAPKGNPFDHLKKGFHAAFPKDEHPDVTHQKEKEAQTHFRKFMHERGGHSKDNTTNLTSQNGKTKLSSGVGFHSTGISLAPGKTSKYKHDLCPKASSECRSACLGLTAGGNRYASSFKGKLLRTHYIHEHPEHAARLLSKEIGHHEKHAEKIGHKHGHRLNVTSDLPYEHLMPKKFFEKHHKTQFYDYTKVHGRLDNKSIPKNYHLSLSHTGTGHHESNDKEAIHALNKGHVVAMVHQKGKVKPTHVEDVQSGKRWKVANGDNDDNTFDRHKTTKTPKHEGVVSGLKLKGVKNEDAGHFANKVDHDGVIRINHPKKDHDHEHHKHDHFNILNNK